MSSDTLSWPILHISTKEAQPEEDPSVSARLQRLQNNYEDFGMRRTVEGILVVHDHGHPHILMLQIANAFFKLSVSYVFITVPPHKLHPSWLLRFFLAHSPFVSITSPRLPFFSPLDLTFLTFLHHEHAIPFSSAAQAMHPSSESTS